MTATLHFIGDGRALRACANVCGPQRSITIMRKLRVGIDFDSTIAAIAEPWLQRFNSIKGTRFQVEHWTDWDLSFLSDADKPTFFSLLTPEIYATVKPYPDAAAVIREWANSGQYELVCVTSNPSTDSEKFTAAKERWLKRYIPELSGTVIAARNKSGLGLDVLVDDAPHHHVSGDYFSVLVRRPWNAGVKCPYAFADWNGADAALRKAAEHVRREEEMAQRKAS